MIQIAYYDGGNHEKREQVIHVLEKFPYSYQCIEEKDIQQRIGTLMRMEGYERQETTSTNTSTMELMIFHEVSDDAIAQVSAALKQANTHVACKAVVTKHNIDWKLFDLLDEIAEEHAYFQIYDALKQAIMMISSLNEEKYTKESWLPYQQACVEGYILLQGQQPKLEDIKIKLQQVTVYYQQLEAQ